MTSSIKLKPIIRKITIKDSKNPEGPIIKEITGDSDAEMLLETSGILGQLMKKGIKPRVEIDLQAKEIKLVVIE